MPNLAICKKKTAHPIQSDTPVNYEAVIDYYSQATNDYQGWSKNFNMHFGYCPLGENPFNLEKMLVAMNQRVLEELELKSNTDNHLMDMGCGVGATMQQLATSEKVSHITGITIVAPQVFAAQEKRAESDFSNKLTFALQDYHLTQFDDETFSGVYAIESACHSKQVNKIDLLKEAYRLLKPGTRFAMADGFMIGDQPLNPLMKYCYQKVCQHWALGNFAEINQLVAAMKSLGFTDIKIENASWRVAPSVAFIPKVALAYLFSLVTQPKHQQSWSHLLAPVFLMPLAVNKNRFGYFIVSGKKPKSE